MPDKRSSAKSIGDHKQKASGYISSPRKQSYPAASLAVPSLKNVPYTIYTGVEFENLSLIRKWARYLLLADPDCRIVWKEGESVRKVASDMICCIKSTLQKEADSLGINEKVRVAVAEGSKITISLYDLYDETCPVIYEDACETVKRNAPGLTRLFDDAVRLLGSICWTWEDIRQEGVDWYEEYIIPDAVDYNDAEYFEEQKAYVESLKESGPSAKFFEFGHRDKETLKERISSFRKKVSSISPGRKEAPLIEWFKDVARLVESNFNLYPNDSLDCYIDIGQSAAILHSRADAVTDYYDTYMNENFNSGGEFGVYLRLEEAHFKSFKEGIRLFREDMETLSLYHRVFKFF